MRIFVGLVLCFIFSFDGIGCEELTIGCSYQCDSNVFKSIRRIESELGLRVKIKKLTDYPSTDIALDKVDAVIIPGGADIHPKYYGRENSPLVNFYRASEQGKERDEYEYQLAKKLVQKASVPTLGICRGMQMLAISQGGKLYLDMAREIQVKNRFLEGEMIVVKDSQRELAQIVEKAKFYGFELHHQSVIPEENENYLVSATSNQGKVVEVLEFINVPILGTQFHPELTSANGISFFKWLIKKACEYQ